MVWQYRTEIDTRLGKERSARVVKTNKITPYLLNLSDKDVKYGLEDAHSWLYDYTTAAKLLGLPEKLNSVIWNEAMDAKKQSKEKSKEVKK